MKIRWSLIGGMLVALSLLSAFAVYGRPGFGPGKYSHGPGGGGFPFRVLTSLTLTAEQQAQIDAIRAAHRDKMRALWGELAALRTEVTDKLLAPGEVAVVDFAQQAERVAQLEAQLFHAQLAVSLEVRKVLTPDQLTKAAEIVAEKRARWAERRRHFEEKKNAP